MATKRILIAGGGIGGMAAALALHRAGVDVTVYERARAFAEIGTGLSLWPNATRVLQSLGVLKRIIALGDPVTQFNLQRSDGTPIASLPMSGYSTPGLCLHRADLYRALFETLPGTSLVANEVIQSFEQGADGVTARFASGQAIQVDGLVGADGINSVIRAQLHGATPPVYRGYCVWRGVTANPGGLVRGHISESWGAGRRFGIMPIGRGRVCWYATRNGPASQPDPAAGRQQEVLGLFRDWHKPIPALIESTPSANILKTDACDRPTLVQWGRGRVTLTGDAAHPMTPNVGQGACMAIEDSAGLAKMLATKMEVAEAFRAFEALRQGRTAYMVRQARRIGVFGQWQNPLLVGGRNFAAKLLLARPPRRRLNTIYGYEI
jgi:2-polyprenyl-6-methoxyphenol hydroxylase-like FAD-dependent oxidoreductase